MFNGSLLYIPAIVLNALILLTNLCNSYSLVRYTFPFKATKEPVLYFRQKIHKKRSFSFKFF